MKREIKFRAWQKNHKKLGRVRGITWNKLGEIEHVCFHNGDNCAPVYSNYYANHEEWSLDCLELMQYTGLKDKNGKEIYEGDIVRGFDNINKHTDPELAPHIEPTYTCGKHVEFIKGGFVLSSKKYPNGGCGNLQTYRPNRSEFIEIIGNIHENPEFL